VTFTTEPDAVTVRLGCVLETKMSLFGPDWTGSVSFGVRVRPRRLDDDGCVPVRAIGGVRLVGRAERPGTSHGGARPRNSVVRRMGVTGIEPVTSRV
jgi:hypothetical protein